MTSPEDPPASGHLEGAAADAIRHAEIALARQNSTAAQVDLQVVTAVLNAHRKVAAGKDDLDSLQRDIEEAVATRSDLDTPAGARDFQRYLIGKLRDIQAVVAGASLDDTSNSALMAAWTTLYQAVDSEHADQRPAGGGPASGPVAGGSQTRTATAESELGPYADLLPEDDLGMPPTEAAVAPPPAPVAMPSLPSFGGGGGLPSGGGFGMPTGFPPTNPVPAAYDALDDIQPGTDDAEDPTERAEDDHQRTDDEHTAAASGPTTVTLPNGETLTAASPQLAAAIEAAAAGTPIAEAFRQQGITIPPPGTAVADPVDPSQLAPGDIGIFTDRHALALGERRALVNGQIQQISTVGGPDFLGWEHPPAPVGASVPNASDPPAPTRPAATERTETA